MSSEYSSVMVEFTATDVNELIELTMLSIGVAESITETQSHGSEKKVRVDFCEYFDVENILDDNGYFGYTYTLPPYAGKLFADDETDVTIDDKTVLYSGKDAVILFRYERGFKFDSIVIDTDLSSLSGKIKRSISFVSPVFIAKEYHDFIKTELEARLSKGMTLNIYDENGNRIYRIDYSSYFKDDVNDFTEKILDASCSFYIERREIPFGKSTINTSCKIGKPIQNMISPTEIIYKYTMRTNTESEKYNGVIDNQAGVKVFTLSSSRRGDFEYKSINWLLSGIAIGFIIIIIVAVFIIVIIIKKTVKKKRTSQSTLKSFQNVP